MTPGKLYELMGRKYLRWNFDTYTNRDRLRPVLRPVFIENEVGVQQIKLEYYQDTSCTQSQYISSEYLDAGLSDEELLSIIDTRMRSDKWFEMPECFTGEQLYSLDLPMGFIKLEKWTEGIRKSFAVTSAGYGAAYPDAAGRCVSTETVFDLCLPTEQLDIGRWYELHFESDQENVTHWRGFPHKYTNQMSLVLTGTLGSWSFGISAYNSKLDPQLWDFYEVRYAPDRNGFLFRIKQKGPDKIWFKAAWLKSAGLDRDLCQQALRRWLE